MTEEHPETSFVKSFFAGVIDEEAIVPFPEATRAERERVESLRAELAASLEGLDPARVDREGALPDGLLERLARIGLMGLGVPVEHGGMGLSTSSVARIFEDVGAADASLAVTLVVHHGLVVRPLVRFGTEAQRRRHLPALASGRCLGAFALTEAGAGSDAGSLTTRATLTDDGSGYVLDGVKIWVTNGRWAELFLVFARTSPLDGSLKPRVTAFLVERAMGAQTGAEEPRMGLRGLSVTALRLENLHVPPGAVLGEAGRGFRVAMEAMSEARIPYAAACLGACRRLLALASARAVERRAFARPLSDLGMIREKLAAMACEIHALEAATYLTAGMVDAGVADWAVEAALCKLLASRTLWTCADEALQIAGGAGYLCDYPYERMLRDARAGALFLGTNEVLRAFVALAGMQGPGRQLAEVARAMREPIKGFGVLGEFALRRARSAFGRERLERVHPALRREAVVFEDGVAALARECERTLRKHGTDIAEMQFVQHRIADVALDLYAIAASLSQTTLRIERRGPDNAREDVELCAGFVELASRRLHERLSKMEREEDELMKQIARRCCERARRPSEGPPPTR
ncbi:MAG: acyl-CoA dehydrogenase family protein [Myxococcales bacterium]|nr:acyl-CoA dehydrogenase family protein [Myxococcales bacterium]